MWFDINRTRKNSFELKKGSSRLDVRGKFFFLNDGDTLEQFALRGCGFHTRRHPSQGGQGSEQSDLVVGNPAHGKGIETK